MRRLLTPRWLVWHALLLLAVLACVGLGWWQLDRAESATGNWQNIVYAVQWPLFGVLIIYAWVRAAMLEVRPPDERPQPPLTGSIVVWLRQPRHAPLERVARPELPAGETSADAAEERALADYNRYLATIRTDEH